MVGAFHKLIAPFQRRLMLMVGRAVVRVVNDQAGHQELQLSLLADEVRDRVERLQEYGFTSVPLPGAEAVAVCVGGARDHAVVVAVDDRRYRLKGLAAGEVALYDDLGQVVHLTRDGIEATSPTRITATAPEVLVVAEVRVTMQTPELHVTGNIVAGGDVSDQTGSMQGMRDTYNPHDHNDPQGGTVGAANQKM